jgi:hypothetical protein
MTPHTVSIEELTRSSSSSSNMLPEAISEALGNSLSEVLDLYFRDISDEQWDRLVWDAIDRRRINVEDEAWLEGESRRRNAVAEMVYRGGDNTF